MLEHDRAVVGQMLNEADCVLLGLADQPGEPSLALDQRQVAQVVVFVHEQVEGVQHRLMARPAAQRAEIRHPVGAGDHRLAVDQERLRLEAQRSVDDGRKRAAQSYPFLVKQRTRAPSRRTIRR